MKDPREGQTCPVAAAVPAVAAEEDPEVRYGTQKCSPLIVNISGRGRGRGRGGPRGGPPRR